MLPVVHTVEKTELEGQPDSRARQTPAAIRFDHDGDYHGNERALVQIHLNAL